MAYKTKRRKATKRPARRVYAVTVGRKTSIKRIGAMKPKGKIGTAVMDAVLTGAGIYLGNMATAMIPLQRPIAGGIVAGGGILAGTMGLPKALTNGFAGAGVVATATALIGPGAVTGIGRKRLTESDVKMIQAAARKDGVRGLTAETIHGDGTPVMRRRELF